MKLITVNPIEMQNVFLLSVITSGYKRFKPECYIFISNVSIKYAKNNLYFMIIIINNLFS